MTKIIAILLIGLILCGIINMANSHGANIPYIVPVIVAIVAGWIVG